MASSPQLLLPPGFKVDESTVNLPPGFKLDKAAASAPEAPAAQPEMPGFLERVWQNTGGALIGQIRDWWNHPAAKDLNRMMDALDLADKLRKENRAPTPEEQAVLDEFENVRQPPGTGAHLPVGTEPAYQAIADVAAGNPAGAAGDIVGGYGVPAGVYGAAKGAPGAFRAAQSAARNLPSIPAAVPGVARMIPVIGRPLAATLETIDALRAAFGKGPLKGPAREAAAAARAPDIIRGPDYASRSEFPERQQIINELNAPPVRRVVPFEDVTPRHVPGRSDFEVVGRPQPIESLPELKGLSVDQLKQLLAKEMDYTPAKADTPSPEPFKAKARDARADNAKTIAQFFHDHPVTEVTTADIAKLTGSRVKEPVWESLEHNLGLTLPKGAGALRNLRDSIVAEMNALAQP